MWTRMRDMLITGYNNVSVLMSRIGDETALPAHSM
ncbi:hypothetical protein M3606_23585 [Cytobacillus horneckiae]|nr:hypothetical protein [Cytobacillus horneckiae]